MQANPVFKVPDELSRKKAIGSLTGTSKLLTGALNSIMPLFKPISEPNPGDWLAETNEKGQTYEDFVKSKKLSSQIKTIRILPLEENIDEDLLKALQTLTQAYYSPVQVVMSSAINIGELEAEFRLNPRSEVLQFQAASVLEKLEKLFSEKDCCTIGVTMTDLYSREDRNFVYGLASYQARVGVFSFARFQDESTFLPWRCCMVIAHEIGHMFGLKHCIYFSCMMNGATHLEERSKPFYLCPVCLRKLQFSIGFNIAERYKNLSSVCKSLGAEFSEASKWYNQVYKLVMQSYGNNYQKYIEEEKKTLETNISKNKTSNPTITTAGKTSLVKKGPGVSKTQQPSSKPKIVLDQTSIPIAKNNLKSQLDLYKGLL